MFRRRIQPQKSHTIALGPARLPPIAGDDADALVAGTNESVGLTGQSPGAAWMSV